MRYEIYDFRHGEFIFSHVPEYRGVWESLLDALDSIDEQSIVDRFMSKGDRRGKSVTNAVNALIKEELVGRGWEAESYIFADEAYQDKDDGRKGIWRLDFAREPLAVEVAFNHRSDVAWNLIKPVLAGELNHVEKRVQCGGGVVVCATQAFKDAVGMDSACGTYDDYVAYCLPLRNLLTVPMAIIGLEAPESFRVAHRPKPNGSGLIGDVVWLDGREG